SSVNHLQKRPSSQPDWFPRYERCRSIRFSMDYWVSRAHPAGQQEPVIGSSDRMIVSLYGEITRALHFCAQFRLRIFYPHAGVPGYLLFLVEAHLANLLLDHGFPEAWELTLHE